MIKEINIKYLRSVDKIEKLSIGDWIVLRCSVDTYIEQGDADNSVESVETD